jgi:hypothetical protein
MTGASAGGVGVNTDRPARLRRWLSSGGWRCPG